MYELICDNYYWRQMDLQTQVKMYSNFRVRCKF